ncbi:MAG TPA: hypothetical protein VGQ31_08405 [Candidatus Limnocylindrales bacterium]|jgi:hypothetical protein|nr:hypothetical protein [Candidatus Limnocylindrales bacterium]
MAEDRRGRTTDGLPRRRSRSIGAAAGLIPASLIALLFAYSGSAAPPAEIAVSLGLVVVIATSAGWLAGPLAGGRRRFLVATIGYAIAVTGTTATLSILQGAAEAVAAHGTDIVAVAIAIAGRAVVAAAGVAYLIVPALVLGSAWSLTARSLSRLVAGGAA